MFLFNSHCCPRAPSSSSTHALRVRSARRGGVRARAAGSQGWAASSAAAPRGGAAAAASSRLEAEGRTNFHHLRRGGRRRRLRLAADAIAVAVVLGGVGSGAAVVDCLSATLPPRTRALSHLRLQVREAGIGRIDERSEKLRIRRSPQPSAAALAAERAAKNAPSGLVDFLSLLISLPLTSPPRTPAARARARSRCRRSRRRRGRGRGGRRGRASRGGGGSCPSRRPA